MGACSHPETTQERGKKSRGGNREGREREGLPIYLRRRASRLLGSNGSLRLAGRRGALICDLGGRRAGGCGGLLPPRLVRGARCGVVLCVELVSVSPLLISPFRPSGLQLFLATPRSLPRDRTGLIYTDKSLHFALFHFFPFPYSIQTDMSLG